MVCAKDWFQELSPEINFWDAIPVMNNITSSFGQIISVSYGMKTVKGKFTLTRN